MIDLVKDIAKVNGALSKEFMEEFSLNMYKVFNIEDYYNIDFYKELENLNDFIEGKIEIQSDFFKLGLKTNNWNGKKIVICEEKDICVNIEELERVSREKVGDSIFLVQFTLINRYEDIHEQGKKSLETINDLENSSGDLFYSKLVKRIQEQKSEKKSCKFCDSTINLKYLQTHYCPVCGYNKFLFTLKDEESLRSRIDRLINHQEFFNEKSQSYYNKIKNQIIDKKFKGDGNSDIKVYWCLIAKK